MRDRCSIVEALKRSGADNFLPSWWRSMGSPRCSTSPSHGGGQDNLRRSMYVWAGSRLVSSRLVSSRWHGTCYSHTMPPVRWYRGQQWAGSRSRSRSHGQPNLLYNCEVRSLYGRRAARIAVRVGAAEGRPCARAMVTITSSRRGTPWRLDWSLIQLLADLLWCIQHQKYNNTCVRITAVHFAKKVQ